MAAPSESLATTTTTTTTATTGGTVPSIPDVAAAAETTNETGEGGAEAGDHTYKFNIAMSCGGCSGAVDRVLKKLDGIKTYTVSLPDQTATVVTSGDELAYETVLKTIKKTGKKVLGAERDGVGMSIDLPEE